MVLAFSSSRILRHLDPFLTTKWEGVGLGLVNAKSIVEGHEGTIYLMSESGKGTRVVVTTPGSDSVSGVAELVRRSKYGN